ncbi:helix-turn-helix domain-containing protein [Pseudonocardia asaccharolytica]|uniref:GAF domain-containing protein n=1 Tax=Pseudonocardia asaccharolytica DSM 44247 = NBRC 16224 TaxID=1123024 RepID=A0A511CW73_9PSEU|nr:helix-turn-helix domain-containing protein [Pseudonocardia asaccharolytica]GEL16826.1 hypothetical protein PA7_06630 [Pseudonocardia asaccharolytica DSM 44247 = NBRC 16224]
MPSPTMVEPSTSTDAELGVLTPIRTSADVTDPALTDLLALVTRAARAELGVARCAVYLLRPGATLQRVMWAAAPGLEPSGDDVRSLDRAPLARESIRTGRLARAREVPGELTLVRPGRIRPAVAVPLLVDGEVLGILEMEDGQCGARDEHAVTGFAALAEAALAQAAQATRTARRERGLAGAEQVRHLLGALTGAVLDGAEIDDIVTLLGDLLGRPVALLGPDLRVRTWTAPQGLRLDSAPSLPPAALGVPAVRAALDRLGPARPSVLLTPRPASGLSRRHLVAVLVAEGQVAGYLDVIEMGRPLDLADTPVAEQAAAVLSLQVLGETRTARAAAQTRDDVLADLLRGSRAADDVRRVAQHVGLDLHSPHLLVRMPVAAGRSPACCRDRVAAAVARVLDAPPPAYAEPDAVVLLVRLPDDPGPPVLRAVHRGLRDALATVAAHTGVRRAVVSGVCRDVPDFPTALAETREIDGIVTALGGRADVVPVTELSTLRLVVNGDRADVAVRFAEQCIGPLRRSDQTTGGDLVETLRSYLASGAQVRATAKALGVHENTVRYRLGRIEHVTGMDMRRFDALLAAQLAFQVEGLTAAEDTR